MYEMRGLFFNAPILLELFQIWKKKIRCVTSQKSESL